MTPELRHRVARRARALQDQLNQFSVGATGAATEAMRIFETPPTGYGAGG